MNWIKKICAVWVAQGIIGSGRYNGKSLEEVNAPYVAALALDVVEAVFERVDLDS